MDVVLTTLPALDSPTEVVERKGIGHPDTICDAVAEELSLALSRFYLDAFGSILHHNVDKVLLAAGSARPAFGGGRIEQPIALYLSGRAVLRHAGVYVPVDELARDAARRWLGAHVPGLDPTRDVEVHSLVRPGAAELVDLFARGQAVPLANDTSCGVGFAPPTPLERAVLAVERALQEPATRLRCPSFGADVKVMGVRRSGRCALTVACAQVDRHLADLDAYRAAMARLEALVRSVAAPILPGLDEIAGNAADDLARGAVYLTVTGTSAECGDDGQAGRGNRVGGLITPGRPMTMESVAGKNPISHVGKTYNVLARQIAESVVAEFPGVAAAECRLVSRIGSPVDEPQLVDLRVQGAPPVAAAVEELVRAHLAQAPHLWRRLLAREFVLF